MPDPLNPLLTIDAYHTEISSRESFPYGLTIQVSDLDWVYLVLLVPSAGGPPPLATYCQAG